MDKNHLSFDSESQVSFKAMGELDLIRSNRVPGVRTVLVVLSSAGLVFDIESLRQKIGMAYPDAAVFFLTTLGTPIGAAAPQQIDLLIDFTGPGQRQSWFYAKTLRRMARVAIGRNAGFFRKRIYDRAFNEKEKASTLPSETLNRERHVQRQVLALAGIAMVQAGDALPNLEKSLPRELPALLKT